MIRLHPHAEIRLSERGVTEEEAIETVRSGEQFAAKFGRTGFRRNFEYNGNWLDKFYASKEVHVIAARDGDGWLVITVMAKFF